MTCQECVQVLHLYLDRELNDSEVIQVDYHLAACGDCGDFFDFKRGVRRLVVRGVADDEAPASLRESVLRLRPG